MGKRWRITSTYKDTKIQRHKDTKIQIEMKTEPREELLWRNRKWRGVKKLNHVASIHTHSFVHNIVKAMHTASSCHLEHNTSETEL